jgi:hypothetical protein
MPSTNADKETRSRRDKERGDRETRRLGDTRGDKEKGEKEARRQ